VIGGGVWCEYELCYIPYRCGVLEKQIELRTNVALQSSDQYSSSVIAHANLAAMAPFLERCARPGLYMMAAANRRIVNQPQLAVNDYRKALTYDLRPEIFFELGLTELEAQHPSAAIDSLTAASLFYVGYLYEIPYQNVRERVAEACRDPSAVDRLEHEWAALDRQ